MKRGEKVLLGTVGAAVLLGLGGGALLLLESRGSRAGGAGPGGGEGERGAEPSAPFDDGSVPAFQPNPLPPKPPAPSDLPLFEVVADRRFDPYAASNDRGAPERGAGRTASLDGRVTDVAGTAVPGAKVRFTHGLNAGEAAATDAEGSYAFPQLYPGAQLLEVEIPGREPILREVRLLPGRPERATYHFAAPFDLAGEVVDRKGKAVPGAEVRIDGRIVATDEGGKFYAGAITPGDLLVYVRAKGYAPLRVPLSLPPGLPPDRDRMRLVLEGAGVLRGESRGSPAEGGAPFAALVPDTPPVDRTFPFEHTGRIEIPGNGPFEIPDVPVRKLLRLRLFHPLARAKPPLRTVFLAEAGERNLVPTQFQFESLRPVRGRVVDGETGKPLAGAAVSLEVADLFRETVAALPGAGSTLNAYVATPPPDLRSETRTDGEGKFSLGTGEGTGWRWLRVSAEGYRSLERAVPPGKTEVDRLVLFREETFEGGGRLVLVFPREERHRAAITLNGSAKEEVEVGPGEPFAAEGLPPGLYEVKIRLGGRILHAVADLPIGARREIRLPD